MSAEFKPIPGEWVPLPVMYRQPLPVENLDEVPVLKIGELTATVDEDGNFVFGTEDYLGCLRGRVLSESCGIEVIQSQRVTARFISQGDEVG